MDVLRLNTTTFLPDLLIEGYTSMIWTERYIGNGEFELTTGLVFPTLDALPEGCFITVRGSTEIMMVESRLISVSAEGYMELKITGRSFETFLEDRVVLASVYGEQWKVYKPYTTAVMAGMLIWDYLVNATTADPMKPPGQPMDTNLSVPNVVVTDSTTYSEAAKEWWVESGVVYDKVQDFLALRGFGLRTIYPNRTTGSILTFNTSETAARGDVTKTSTANIQQLRVDIYQGLDRSHVQTARPAVIFHYDSGHVDNPSYLFSVKEYKNMAVVASSVGVQVVWKEGATPADKQAAGLDKRVLFLDGGTKNDTDNQTDFMNSLTQKGQIELKKTQKVRLFDGAISPISPFVYRKDYFLGDLVTVMARFGFTEIMFVNEYVRTENSEGDQGYPGLIAL